MTQAFDTFSVVKVAPRMATRGRLAEEKVSQ